MKQLFSDIWFSGVKMAEEVMAEGVYYCGTVKARQKGFGLSILEDLKNIGLRVHSLF